MLSETIHHGHALAIEHFGEAEARRLARLGDTNVAEMLAFLRQRHIQCDYEPTGRLMVALSTAHLDEARNSVEIAERLGVKGFCLLDRQAIRAELDSPLFLGGVSGVRGRHPRSGQAGRGFADRGGAPGSAGFREHGSAGPRAARTNRMEGETGGHRREDILQLLPAHPRQSNPLGNQRGDLLPGQPGGSIVRPLAEPLQCPAGELPAPLSSAWREVISLWLGGRHLGNHAAHAVLRKCARWTSGL
jgi:hypothetical protein